MMKCSMDQNNRADAVDGPVVSEGGRSPSTLSPGQGTPPAKNGAALGRLAPGQRWSAARKGEVGLRLQAEVALEGALKERESDPAETQLAAALQRIGELSMEIELLRAKMERSGPLARRRSR
jgi:transposase